MKPTRTPRPHARAFTLVELLLVMGIIVMLVGLLTPAVNQAIVAARVAGTENIIRNLAAGLEAFKADWQIFPPSDNAHDSGARSLGYEAVGYYLMGPDGRGWGTNATGTSWYRKSPFGGEASGAYGPYYKMEVGGSTTDYVMDAFRPGKAIFYYRYEPAETDAFDFKDNGSAGDTALVNNFASQAHFQLLAKPLDPASGAQKWVRPDFLLISAGADRLWGYAKEEQGRPTGKDVTQTDIDSGAAVCDDICNFKR